MSVKVVYDPGLLERLRALMAERGLLGYVVPSADAHAGEYVAECDKRRQALCGFSGSAGTCVVTATRAALWTDGRYFAQAAEELQPPWELVRDRQDDTPTFAQWLLRDLPRGSRVGADAEVLTPSDVARLRSDAALDVSLARPSLVDAAWGARRPPLPSGSVFALAEGATSRDAASKVRTLSEEVRAAGADAVVVCELADVAWLFNVRGSDVPCNPVFRSYAVISAPGAGPHVLFADSQRFEPSALAAVASAGAEIRPYADAAAFVQSLAAAGKKVWLDPDCVNMLVAGEVPEPQVVSQPLPLKLRKAVKDAAEQAAARKAYLFDGSAVIAFIAWLEEQVHTGKAITEFEAAEQLEEFRRKLPGYLGPSFETIGGYGKNGAIIHYEPLEGKSAVIGTDAPFLLDTGGQFACGGTTDTTRTVHFGLPTEEQRHCYTVVLKSHIALASSIFPANAHPHTMDTVARQIAWSYGMDYAHGTGHGVGALLTVHEAPVMSSSSGYKSITINEDMIITVEPGFYDEGKFGIRLESTGLIVDAGCTRKSGRGSKFLTFDILTRVPIQTSLIDNHMLTPRERAWLNKFNSSCAEAMLPLLSYDQRATDWLRRNTVPLTDL